MLQEDPFKGNILSKSDFHRMGKVLFGSKEVVCFALHLGKKCLIGASSSLSWIFQ